MNKIGIVGLGKLGLSMLAAFVHRGFDVKGYDVSKSLLADLQQGIVRSNEPGIKEIAQVDHTWTDRFSTDLQSVFDHGDTIFIIVPTPSQSDDSFSLDFVTDAINQINQCYYKNKVIKNIVVSSTVNPGDCDKLRKLLDSNLKLFYSPEFIAIGSVVQDLLHPDLCIIGTDSDAVEVQKVYQKFYKSTPQYSILSFKEAEVAKIAINSYITIKISFANTIGSLLYNLTNGDTNKIKRTLEAIGSDSRINNKYFKFGPGFGGPCFPRDNKCLNHHLINYGIHTALPTASDGFNEWLLEFFTDKLKLMSCKNLVVVGLSYKPNCDLLEESFVLDLVNNIKGFYTNLYFIDKNVQSYPGMQRILDTTGLDQADTLFLVNYTDSYDLFSNYCSYKLWAD